MLLGNMNVTKANVLSAGNINPGIKYHKYDPTMTNMKNRYREIFHPSAMRLRRLWRVLRKVVVASKEGQIIAEG
jgi:hypothetical protein